MKVSDTPFLPAAFSLILTITACDELEPQPEPAQAEETPSFRDAPPSQEFLEETFCSAKRQIARRIASGSGCPDVSDWVGSAVFPNATGVLAKFCKYEWEGLGAVDVGALQTAAHIEELAPDCGGVFMQNNEDWEAVRGDAQAAFRHGIGRVSATELDLPASESSRSPVRVVVVDTVPEHSTPITPRSEHGELMFNLVNDVACPAGPGTCAVEVVRELGLPRYDDGEKDLINGGVWGTQFDIARAIYNAVEDWKALHWCADPQNCSNEEAKLIINLSVGWDRGTYGDTSGSTPRPSAVAAHLAIEYAICYGAIVVAAAGNQGYTCTTGPLAPAAWEAHSVPTAQRCAALGAPNPPAGVSYNPLVYSVGGLTHERTTMVLSRLEGMPRFAALATNAVAGGEPETVTGTSVAAAVTSGAAALLWSYYPSLSPSAVMQLLYQNGKLTSLDANYPVAGTNVKALDACAALEAACALSGGNCPHDADLNCDADPPSTLADVLSGLSETSSHPVGLLEDQLDCPLECPNVEVPSPKAYIYDDAPAACPQAMATRTSFALPQPGEWGCSNCWIDYNQTAPAVYAWLDDTDGPDTGAEITEVEVAILDNAGTPYYYRFGEVELTENDITRIDLEPSKLPASISRATISITYDSGATIVDPLLIGPQ